MVTKENDPILLVYVSKPLITELTSIILTTLRIAVHFIHQESTSKNLVVKDLLRQHWEV